MFGPGSEDNPSGKCDSCPKNVWGSGSKDPADTRGPKACREGRLVYFLRPGSILPVVIQLPPTSIKPLKNYMLRLTNSQRPYWSVVTRLALEQHTDKGVKWSTIVPTVVSMLDADQFPAVKAFSASVKSIASQQRGPAPAPAAAPETSDSSG